MAKTGLLSSLGQALGKINTDPLSVFRGPIPGTAQSVNPLDPRMSEAVMGFPSIPMGPVASDDPRMGGITGRTPGSDPGLVITGDGWHPHKPTLLGAIADAYLMSRGGKPAFALAREQKNMQEAMAGFADDPQKAINRLAQIRGHGDDAWKMYNEYTDNSRQQGNLDRQNKLYDLKLEEIVRDRTAGILGTITPEMDAATKARVIQRAKSYASGKGFQDVADSIPDNADTIDIDSIRYGEIPVAKQEGLKRSDRRLDQADERLTETERHNRTTEGQAATNEAGRNNRHNNPVARPTAQPGLPNKPYMTKYGPMVMSKDGTKGFIKWPDGTMHGYVRINDKMVPIGEVKVK